MEIHTEIKFENKRKKTAKRRRRREKKNRSAFEPEFNQNKVFSLMNMNTQDDDDLFYCRVEYCERQ